MSQYCETLWSEIRLSEEVDGANKSDGNTGSQITKTRTLVPGCSSNSSWNAEAPRKQTGQVGESITITRTELAELLNESFSEEKLESVNRTKGCWPFGTVLPP